MLFATTFKKWTNYKESWGADKNGFKYPVSLTNLLSNLPFLHEKSGNDFVVITAGNGCSLRESNPQLVLRRDKSGKSEV